MSLYHDVMEALTPLVEAFDHLGIAYYIGGSVSSSLHGMARQPQDVDVIADIRPDQVRPLVQALHGAYYLDEQAWQAAIRHGTLYNVIHLNTMLKIDLIPLKRRAFTREEAHRAQPHLLEAGSRPVRIASAEDAILAKLEWFDMGGRSSGRQWNDILGIMKRQTAALDLAYLRHGPIRWECETSSSVRSSTLDSKGPDAPLPLFPRQTLLSLHILELLSPLLPQGRGISKVECPHLTGQGS